MSVSTYFELLYWIWVLLSKEFSCSILIINWKRKAIWAVINQNSSKVPSMMWSLKTLIKTERIIPLRKSNQKILTIVKTLNFQSFQSVQCTEKKKHLMHDVLIDYLYYSFYDLHSIKRSLQKTVFTNDLKTFNFH